MADRQLSTGARHHSLVKTTRRGEGADREGRKNHSRARVGGAARTALYAIPCPDVRSARWSTRRGPSLPPDDDVPDARAERVRRVLRAAARSVAHAPVARRVERSAPGAGPRCSTSILHALAERAPRARAAQPVHGRAPDLPAHGVFLSFAAKKAMADDAPLATVKRRFERGETFAQVVERTDRRDRRRARAGSRRRWTRSSRSCSRSRASCSCS